MRRSRMSSMIFGSMPPFSASRLWAIPFVMRGPVPRGDQDRDLGQFGRKDRVVAHQLAEPRGVPRHFGAVEPGHHRRRRRAALAGDRLVVGLLSGPRSFRQAKAISAASRFPLVFQSLRRLRSPDRAALIIFRIADGLRQRYIEFRDATAKVDPTSPNGNAECPIWKNSAAKPAPGWKPIARRKCASR